MSHWSSIWMVAQREMRERFRGRAFKISTLIAAAVVAALIVVPSLNKSEKPIYDVGLVNVTNPVIQAAVRGVGPIIGATLRVRDVTSVQDARRDVRTGALDIALVEGRRIIVDERAGGGPRLEEAAAATRDLRSRSASDGAERCRPVA